MDQLNLVLAALVGLATTALIGGVKKLEAQVNTQFISKLGNLTPLLVVVLNFLLPKASTMLGLTNIPDATALLNAPVATLVAIALREAAVKVLHQPDPGATGPAGVP